jgi:hypothetical protein
MPPNGREFRACQPWVGTSILTTGASMWSIPWWDECLLL